MTSPPINTAVVHYLRQWWLWTATLPSYTNCSLPADRILKFCMTLTAVPSCTEIVRVNRGLFHLYVFQGVWSVRNFISVVWGRIAFSWTESCLCDYLSWKTMADILCVACALVFGTPQISHVMHMISASESFLRRCLSYFWVIWKPRLNLNKIPRRQRHQTDEESKTETLKPETDAEVR